MTTIKDTLKKNQLSITAGREKILSLFITQKGALAHGDIEKKMGADFDRVTIYRTLQTFMEKGIIHSIPSSDNIIRYALCKENCAGGHHHDHHVHFLCSSCSRTYCLDDIVTPAIKMPKGYSPQQIEVVVNGVCKKCNASK